MEGAGGVQHGVGHVLLALVHHVFDVQARLGGHVGDGVDQARLVPVQHADAAAAGALLGDGGHIHAVADVAVQQVIPQFIGSHHGAVLLAFGGGSAQVRRAHHIAAAQQSLGGEVGEVTGQLAVVQRVQQGGLVHQLAAGVVQQACALLHAGKGRGIQKALGLGGDGDVQGQVIALAQHLGQVHAVNHRAGQVPGSLHADVGVVAVDFHAQMHRIVGNLDADGAQADDAQLFAVQLRADKLLFALLHLFGQVHVLALQAVQPGVGGGQVAAAHDERADGQLGHSAGVGAGGVKHHNALLRAAVQRDVVHAGTRTGNGQQAVGQLLLVQRSAAHQNGVGGFSVIFHLEAVLGQPGQARRRDLIQSLYTIHNRFYLLAANLAAGGAHFRAPPAGPNDRGAALSRSPAQIPS